MTSGGKRVLLLSLVFHPDTVSTAQLFGEVVEDLVAMGWKVVVVTTKPHYNPPPTESTNQPLAPFWGGLLAQSDFHGATVFHTAMPLKGKNVAIRIAGWIGFHILGVLVVLVKVGKVDVILAPSPPLSMGVAAWLTGRLKHAPFIYNVQELYPDTAVSLGAVGKGVLLDLLRAMERFVYEQAFAVTTIAPGMARRIRERTANSLKVRLIPNFVDTRVIGPRPRDNAFSREFGLSGRFTVVYAGNMGPAQGLEALLEAAKLTQDDARILYVFVGDGTSGSALRSTARLYGLPNVLFIPHQSYDRVPDIYGASDLCIVPLARSLVEEAVPSKVYRIMAAERRILAIADKDSDLAVVVRESGAGTVVGADDPIAIATAISSAANGLDTCSPKRGRKYVIDHVDRARIMKAYSELLNEAVKEMEHGVASHQ